MPGISVAHRWRTNNKAFQFAMEPVLDNVEVSSTHGVRPLAHEVTDRRQCKRFPLFLTTREVIAIDGYDHRQVLGPLPDTCN